jgi:hypothetical protein
VVADRYFPSYKNNGLVPKALAPKLSPKPLTLGFLASLLRQVQKDLTPNMFVKSKIEAAFEGGVEHGKTLVSQDATKLLQLEESLEAFERVSGITIDRWNGPSVGKAVRQVMHYGEDRLYRELGNLQRTLSNALQNVERDLKEYRSVLRDEERTEPS